MLKNGLDLDYCSSEKCYTWSTVNAGWEKKYMLWNGGVLFSSSDHLL